MFSADFFSLCREIMFSADFFVFFPVCNLLFKVFLLRGIFTVYDLHVYFDV